MKRAVAIILILLMVAGVFTVIGFATTAKAADNGICESERALLFLPEKISKNFFKNCTKVCNFFLFFGIYRGCFTPRRHPLFFTH